MPKYFSRLTLASAFLTILGTGINNAHAATPVAPGITTQPANATVTAPATATFKVVATGTPVPTYQWMEEAPGGTSYTAITGATKASYTTAATALTDSGTQFECVVTNQAGSVTSNAATLTVNPAVAPTVKTQPANAIVIAPATATFKVVATGTPVPTYQWMEEAPGGTSYTAITGATKASYTTAATALTDSGTQFECVVTNQAGSVTSNAATLTVNPAVAPTFTTQPANVTVIAPATATFKVVATGTPVPTYQWMEEAPGGTSYTAITGATKASYTTAATALTDSGTQFECVVTNQAGSVTSNAATLTVNPAVAPTFTTQPANVTVIAPATATFKVVATGTPVPTYQWMEEAPGGTSFTAITGATKASYTTAATALTDSGTQFECVVTNQAGSVTSNAATLTVNPAVAPTVKTQPVNKTVIAPATATFKVVATGTPVPTYQWMEEAPGGTSFTAITGATKASYTTAATALTDSGTQFECVVTNQAGSVTSNAATLTVNSTSVAPTITTQPANVTVTAPSTATFTVAATGPSLTYQWEELSPVGYIPISGATSASYTTPATTVVNNGAQFICVVSNASGSVTSNPATLTVNPSLAITTQPANVTVTAPSTATFTVAATGPSLTYQWEEYSPIGVYIPISGATSASYTTPATAVVNNGAQFICVVSNASGSVTSSASILTVNPSLAITTQPANVTVTAPSTATFTVAATGPSLTYQWEEYSPVGVIIPISGATSVSYTTPATTVGNNGAQFICVVSNASGSVTSSAGILTVNPSLAITTQPANVTVTAPSTATFTVAATGPSLTYQWEEYSPVGAYIPISGATSASYTTPATTVGNNGAQFICVVSNASGSATSNAGILTVNVVPSITTQPANATVIVSSAATFTVAGTGMPMPTYQWMQEAPGAASYTAITGAINASYTTPPTILSDSGTKFECVVSNALGSVTSSAAALTVDLALGITSQPANATVIAPATATFTVAATGTSTLSYQWMQEASGSSSFTAISGATSASYTTPATTTANSGTQYECVIIDTGGTVTSNAATLTVNAASAMPAITTQPVNVTVNAPATATFTVAATGPSLTYQWEENIPFWGVFVPIPGATSASYTTPATTIANSGTQYVCVVSNASGSVTSSAGILTVNLSLAITTQPVNVTVNAPATATFTVAATGPSLTYQWEENIPFWGVFVPIPGATSASYSTPATTVANSGTQYICVVSNASGSVTSSAGILTVNLSLAITTQPVNVTVNAPSTATFTVAATGPSLTYQWEEEFNFYSAFVPIPGATSASYTTLATTVANSGTQYICVVSNASGSVTSNPAILTVNLSVSITTQPVNVTVTTPATATFTVAATGPSLTYQWEENILLLGFVPIPGATSASYTTLATTVANSGTQYICIVSNASGSVTSSAAILTVYDFPRITTQPTSLTVTAPTTATFTVAATGTPAPTYQWQQEASGAATFTAISGATSASYTTPATTVADNGTQYECVLTNALGNVTSSAATLTVDPEPLPVVSIASPANQTTLTTGSINITALATEGNGAIVNVTFYNGTTLIGTAVSPSQAFTYIWTNVPAGTYNLTAVAINSTGGTTTSLPVTVIIKSSPFTYGIDNNLLTGTDALNHTTSLQYDNDNRLLKITYADASTVASAYDLFGNQISVTDQRGNTLTKTYDAYERLAQTKDPLGGITQFNYDTNGDLLTLADADGHNTTYTYDPNNRVLTQTNALNLTTTFAYDSVGNVSTRTDANAKATNYTYDAVNRLTNTAYPDGTSVANAYDALGRRTSMTDSTGQTTYAYDALSRLLSKTSPGTNNTIAYTYDSEDNRLTSVDQNNRSISNTYDVLNRLASVTDPNGTTDYAYDADSNELSVKTPNGVTESYTYDALNRALTAVNATGSGVITSFSNVYDIAGMITKKTLQDGSWTAYSYDALNRLLSEVKQTSSSTIYNYVYTYDPVGNRLTWTKNTTLGNFWSVDSLDMPPQVLANMTTAGYGNTATPSQTLTLARSYSNDAANRLTNWNYIVNVGSGSFPVQTDTYTYDNNGNRLSKQAVLTGQAGTPQQTAYAYDFENRLNQLNYVNIPNITGTQTDSLIYNGEGLRTQGVINSVAANYLYDGFNVLNERDGSGNTTKTYTRGLDFGGGIGSLINQNFTASSTAVTQYYNYDDLGSTANLTTSTGTTASSYTYDAFGNLLTPPASTDTNRYLFSTKEFDSRSALQFFGYRYYDPEIGRWLTPDPLGLIAGRNIMRFFYFDNVSKPLTINQLINLYVYAGNNPVNFIDLWGFKCTDKQKTEYWTSMYYLNTYSPTSPFGFPDLASSDTGDWATYVYDSWDAGNQANNYVKQMCGENNPITNPNSSNNSNNSNANMPEGVPATANSDNASDQTLPGSYGNEDPFPDT